MSGLEKTRFPGVYRRKSKRGKKFDTFTGRIYDANAPSQQRWLGTFATAEEARDAKNETEKRNQRSSKAQLTVQDFADIWLTVMPRTQHTAAEYGYAIKGLVSAFGDELLDNLKRPAVRTWGYQAPYQQFQVARTMLGDATDLGYMDANPLSVLRRPRPKGRKNHTPPTLDDIREMAALSEQVVAPKEFGRRYGLFLLFAAGSLMRPGEIAGMDFDDLDWDENIIRIRDQVPSDGEERRPKSKVIRIAAFTPLAQEAIQSVPAPWTGRVFPNRSGESARTNVYGYDFAKVRAAYLAKHNLSQAKAKLTLYLATRHAGATYMRNELGLSKEDIALQLGQVGTDLVDLYSHPDDSAGLRRIQEAWSEKAEEDNV